MFSSHRLAAQTAPAASTSAEKPTETASGPKVLEPFEVTGSRVKRLDYETPAPVITYTAETIEAKGYTTLGEFVQSLPFNNSTANAEFTTASFITGAATINPRGLGSNRVLTLVNGRRSVPYALTNSASGTAQTVFDFNAIPQAAIDRVEFQKDGASAIYGSDAITGVYNIILKKAYEGSSVDFFVSNTLKHDSLFKRASLFTGLSRDGWNITVSFNYQSRHDNFLDDFGINTTDFRYLGVKGTNQNSTIFHPAYLNLTAAQATAAGLGTGAGVYIIPGPVGVTNPTRSNFVFVGAGANIPNTNRFDFANNTQIYPASERYGGHAYLSKTLTPNLTAFMQLLANRSNTHYKFSPYGYTTSIAGFTLPASNPYNPTGVSFTNTAAQIIFPFRGEYLPRREVVSKIGSVVTGLEGRIFKEWNWTSAINYGRSKANRDTDLIKAADLQAALNGTTRATAWNPFGPSDDPDLERRLYTRSKGLDNDLYSFSYDASVTGSVWKFPWSDSGELGVATGYEYRHEHLDANPEPNNFIGFTATTPYSGGRYVNAGFVEISAPLKRWLELQLAGRSERYSDFGWANKPKIGAKVRLPANEIVNVIVRGSYSESFKAPDIGQLYQPQSNATTSASYLDPLRPQDAARQLRTIVGGNPNLKPEEGKIQYVGGVFELPWIKGLSFSVDYFDQKIDNQINTLSASFLLSREGIRLFPNAIVRDQTVPQPGPILFFYGISNNLGFQLFRGLDYNVHYDLRNTRWGNFTFSGDATQVLKRGSDANQGAGFGNATGYYFAPVWRYNYSMTWRWKNFGASVAADIIGRYYNDRQSTATFPGWGENVFPIITPTFTYRGIKRTTISISSNNVFDKRPPPNGFLPLGFDDRTYANGVLGRTIALRVRRDF